LNNFLGDQNIRCLTLHSVNFLTLCLGACPHAPKKLVIPLSFCKAKPFFVCHEPRLWEKIIHAPCRTVGSIHFVTKRFNAWLFNKIVMECCRHGAYLSLSFCMYLLLRFGSIPKILFSFFLLDQKETKNQGCRKIAKIYCMPLRRISILAAFVFQSANALFSSLKQLKIFAA
jgi:hypothetical protein